MSDRLEALEALLPALPLARQTELFGHALVQLRQQLEEMAPDIGRLEDWQPSVTLVGEFWEKVEREEVLEALGQLKSFGDQIEAANDREQLTQITEIASGVKPDLVLALRDAARAWGRRIDHDLGSLGSLGTLLVQFSDTRALGLRMVALARIASTLKNSFPPKGLSLEQHKTLLKDAEQIRTDLAAIGAGESVQKFLAALGNQSATLDLVDQSVLEWIRERSAESRFQIRLNETRSSNN